MASFLSDGSSLRHKDMRRHFDTPTSSEHLHMSAVAQSVQGVHASHSCATLVLPVERLPSSPPRWHLQP